MADETKCLKHPDTNLEDTDCYRCRGDGYTDSDIEDMDNPLEFSNGECWQCKGSGILKAANCWKCDQEFELKEEYEDFA